MKSKIFFLRFQEITLELVRYEGEYLDRYLLQLINNCLNKTIYQSSGKNLM
jgi:hypothetical protein